MATYHIETDKGTFEIETDENAADKQSFPDALKSSFNQVTSPLATAAEKLQPKNLTGLLPAAGAMAGTAVLPGVGTSVGAGMGSIAQKIADMVYGTSGPVEPTTSFMGIPMAPKAAIDPMLNTALAGGPETTEGQAAGKAISETYESAKPGFKKTLSKVAQTFTGKSAAKVRQLIEDPTAILPEGLGGAKSVENASNQYGEALENSSVFHPEGYVTRGVEKIDFSPFERGHSEADTLAQKTWDKWKAGEPISAKEAYDAKRATDYTWPKVVREGNQERIRLLSEFKTGMDDIMSNPEDGLPKVLKASKDYARARIGADFTQILPRTKTGDISTVKTLLLHTLSPKGYAIPLAGLTSPAVTGIGNLAAQAGMKGLNLLSSDPAIRQTLLGLLQQMRAKKNK